MIQGIDGPRRSIITQEVRNSDPLDTSINIIYSKHRDPTPTWNKVIGSKFSNKSRTNVYACNQMNLVSETVLRKIPNFIYFGLSSVNTTYELRLVFSHTNRIGSATPGSNWLPRSHRISGATADRVSGTKAKYNYNF